jgi:hypothetical protein
MKKIIRLTESDLTRIVRRVIRENKTPEWVDSLERRLNREIDFNYGERFVNSPQASVYSDGEYVDIKIMYDKFMGGPFVGIQLNNAVRRIMEEMGEEIGINFKFISHNVGTYEHAYRYRDSSEYRDFSNDLYRLKFRYKIIPEEM